MDTSHQLREMTECAELLTLPSVCMQTLGEHIAYPNTVTFLQHCH